MTGILTTDGQAVSAFPASGPIQRRDARLRVVFAVTFSIVVVALSTLPALITAVGFAALLACAARLPLAPTVRRLAAMDAFMLAILVFLPFTMPGQTVFAIGRLTASAEGVRQAIEIVLTANAVILALLALVGTIEPARLGHALHRLGVSDKLVHLLLFTVRYVAVLQEEYARLRRAMTARAFRARGTMHTWRSLGWLFGMLLVRSFERAERILAAMKCRGFAGRFHVIDDRVLSGADYRFGVAAGVGLVMLIAVEAVA